MDDWVLTLCTIICTSCTICLRHAVYNAALFTLSSLLGSVCTSGKCLLICYISVGCCAVEHVTFYKHQTL